MTFHRILAQLDDFSFAHVSSLENLPRDLNSYAALVLHYHHKSISIAALARLDTFVKSRGGILAIHAATASFKEGLAYFEILGGRFTGHGPVEQFEVRRVRDDLFSGLDEFVVRDELYIHELQPGIEVHFTATHADRVVPVVWIYRYGAGKVCYAVSGHTTASMRNRRYQRILQRGLEWITERI